MRTRNKLLIGAVLLVLLAAGAYSAYRYWPTTRTGAGLQPMETAGQGSADVDHAAHGMSSSESSVASEESVASAQAIQYAPVQISEAQQRLIGVATDRVQYRTLNKSIRTVGRVEVDETRIARVHSKISGWADRVFADYTYQHVQQG